MKVQVCHLCRAAKHVLWQYRYVVQTAHFIQPEHDVHALHALTGRTFHQIIDRREHNQLPAARGKSNVAEVCRLYPVDIGRAFDQPHEEGIAIKVRKHFTRGSRRDFAICFRIYRRKDSARNGQRMRHENKFILPVADRSQFLLNLRHVLMLERLVGIERIAALGMMSIRRSLCARTRRAGFSVDDHPATQ